jgi:hypothetical protein
MWWWLAPLILAVTLWSYTIGYHYGTKRGWRDAEAHRQRMRGRK